MLADQHDRQTWRSALAVAEPGSDLRDALPQPGSIGFAVDQPGRHHMP
jgi:hypothetical protein